MYGNRERQFRVCAIPSDNLYKPKRRNDRSQLPLY